MCVWPRPLAKTLWIRWANIKPSPQTLGWLGTTVLLWPISPRHRNGGPRRLYRCPLGPYCEKRTTNVHTLQVPSRNGAQQEVSDCFRTPTKVVTSRHPSFGVADRDQRACHVRCAPSDSPLFSPMLRHSSEERLAQDIKGTDREAEFAKETISLNCHQVSACS